MNQWGVNGDPNIGEVYNYLNDIRSAIVEPQPGETPMPSGNSNLKGVVGSEHLSKLAPTKPPISASIAPSGEIATYADSQLSSRCRDDGVLDVLFESKWRTWRSFMERYSKCHMDMWE